MSTPPLRMSTTRQGLIKYDVWSPYFPRWGTIRKWEGNVAALVNQVRPALRDFIERFGKPDVIHARAVYPGGAAAVELGREFNIPVGITEHLGPFPGKQLSHPNGRPLPFIYNAYTGAAKHAADGKKLASRLVELDLTERANVIPNYLDDNFGSIRTNFTDTRPGFTFLSIGGPSYAKGTDLLLRAFSKLEGDVSLVIAGAGAEISQFRDMANEMRITEKVSWVGGISREDISPLIHSCDAFVLPSRGENFGVVYIEALAHGKPLIATRCGGPEDIVTIDNGLLVDMNDVAGLASAMTHMRLHAKEYDPLKLRADFLARFSAGAVIPLLEAWFNSIISQSAGCAKR